MDTHSNLVFFFTALFCPNWIWSLKLTGTLVPYYAVLHREGWLDCNFDLGNDRLYALKWYKDGHEFFRFKPSDQPPITLFPVDGVFVNGNRSSVHHVHLDHITLQSKGDYRCEISADAPSFQTLDEEKYMRIMVLPQKGPSIRGIYPWYNVGDNFTAECDVIRSFPEATLTWFINEAQVDPRDCGCVTFESSEGGTEVAEVSLFNSSTQLKFPIDSNYFRNGAISVECRATFLKSSQVLKDVVVSNVKSGLGLQFAMQSGGSTRESISSIFFPFVLIVGILVSW